MGVTAAHPPPDRPISIHRLPPPRSAALYKAYLRTLAESGEGYRDAEDVWREADIGRDMPAAAADDEAVLPYGKQAAAKAWAAGEAGHKAVAAVRGGDVAEPVARDTGAQKRAAIDRSGSGARGSFR